MDLVCCLVSRPQKSPLTALAASHEALLDETQVRLVYRGHNYALVADSYRQVWHRDGSTFSCGSGSFCMVQLIVSASNITESLGGKLILSGTLWRRTRGR